MSTLVLKLITLTSINKQEIYQRTHSTLFFFFSFFNKTNLQKHLQIILDIISTSKNVENPWIEKCSRI